VNLIVSKKSGNEKYFSGEWKGEAVSARSSIAPLCRPFFKVVRSQCVSWTSPKLSASVPPAERNRSKEADWLWFPNQP
jgi:hypothetical protein